MSQSISVVEPMIVGMYEKYKLVYASPIKKQKVYLLGSGWLAKGFLDNIDKNKYFVINISRHKFVNTPLLLDSLKNKTSNEIKLKNIDKKYDETIESIDLTNKVIKTNLNTFNWSGSYVVCGLGSHVDQGQYWTEKITMLNEINLQKTPKKICVVGAGPTGTELSFYLSEFKHKITLMDGLHFDQLYPYLSLKGKHKLYKRLYANNIYLYKINSDIFSKTIIVAEIAHVIICYSWISCSKIKIKALNLKFMNLIYLEPYLRVAWLISYVLRILI